MIYEVYGRTYLNGGLWGESFVSECKTKKEAVRVLHSIVDGQQYTNGTVYKLEHPDDDPEIVHRFT